MTRTLSPRTQRRIQNNIADGFEAAMDHVKELDPVTFAEKREAAEAAARLVMERLWEANNT